MSVTAVMLLFHGMTMASSTLDWAAKSQVHTTTFESGFNVIEELLPDSQLALSDVDALFTTERANFLVCKTSAAKLISDIERISVQPPDKNGVIIFQHGGGFGNELNTLMRATLIALQLNRTLCAHSIKSQTMGFLSSPLAAAFDPARESACTAMMKTTEEFTKVRNVRDKRVAIHTGTWNGADRDFKAVESLAHKYRIQRAHVFGCISNVLFRPNEEVRRYVAPYLQHFRGADISLGVHIRSGDFAMARHQGYEGTRLLSLLEGREGSITEKSLARKVFKNTPLQCSAAGTPPTRAVVFVGADRETDPSVWRNLTSVVTVLKTPGHPTHTGRPSTKASEGEGALKAVADFFILTEVEWFASNINYATLFGNTFAMNIHHHRAPANKRYERVAPNYDCHFYHSASQGSTRSSCSTEKAYIRSNYPLYAPIGRAVQLAPSCGLLNFPELVPGPKKGDDDKRLCSTMLDETRFGDVIVSLGSNNEFGFEEQMLQCAPSVAHVATFDCTVQEATNKPHTSRVSFHRYCIGNQDTGNYRTWESISSMALTAAAHGSSPVTSGRIAVLKMDVEGWEWTALPQVLQSADRNHHGILPRQIAVEIHLKTHLRYNVPGFVQEGDLAVLPKAPQKLIQLRATMEKAGYSLVDRNDNPFCSHCSELLFALTQASNSSAV